MVSTEVRSEIQPRLVIERVDDAIAFYRATFGAEPIERYVDASGVVVHAAIRIGTSIVTMAEEVKAWKLLGPSAIGGSPVLLHLTLHDPDAACARATERGGAVVVPIQDRPWGKREGRIRDPFGHLWILSCPIKAPSARRDPDSACIVVRQGR
jgi:PhnB protein